MKIRVIVNRHGGTLKAGGDADEVAFGAALPFDFARPDGVARLRVRRQGGGYSFLVLKLK